MDTDGKKLSKQEVLDITDPITPDSNSQEPAPEIPPVDWDNPTYQDGISEFIDPRDFSDQINPRMFHDGLPHSGPILHVEERLPADINYLTDKGEVQRIAAMMGWRDAHVQEFALEVVMNDLSVVYLPFEEWESSGNRVRQVLESLIPKVLKWEAIVNGEDPSVVPDEWEHDLGLDYPDYDDIMEISEIDKIRSSISEVEGSFSGSSDNGDDETDYNWMDEW